VPVCESFGVSLLAGTAVAEVFLDTVVRFWNALFTLSAKME